MTAGILGALIAGGAARRFGSDKALAAWRGQAMIARAADALRPWCAALVVVGAAFLAWTVGRSAADDTLGWLEIVAAAATAVAAVAAAGLAWRGRAAWAFGATTAATIRVPSPPERSEPSGP